MLKSYQPSFGKFSRQLWSHCKGHWSTLWWLHIKHMVLKKELRESWKYTPAYKLTPCKWTETETDLMEVRHGLEILSMSFFFFTLLHTSVWFSWEFGSKREFWCPVYTRVTMSLQTVNFQDILSVTSVHTDASGLSTLLWDQTNWPDNLDIV